MFFRRYPSLLCPVSGGFVPLLLVVYLFAGFILALFFCLVWRSSYG